MLIRCRRVAIERRGREGKKPRPSYKDGSSSGRNLLGFKDRPKFKKGHHHSGNTTTSRNSNVKVKKLVPKKGNDRNALCSSKRFGKFGRLHVGECLVGTNDCYGCGKSGNLIRDV